MAVDFSWLSEIQQNPFLLRAITGLLLLAPLCALLGVQVINYRMAFFSDALSHSAFTGIAIGIIFGIDPRWTVVAFTLLVGAAITYVRRHYRLSLDTVIGVFNSAVIAFGIVVISARQGLTRDLQRYLYGDILSISAGELQMLALLLVAALVFGIFYSNRLLAVSVHEELAAAGGTNIRLTAYLNQFFVALVVAFGLRAVGILLITALLVVPGAAARNLAHNSRSMFWWTMLICFTSALLGIVGSLYFNCAAGAAIILAATGWFLLTTLIGRLRGAR